MANHVKEIGSGQCHRRQWQVQEQSNSTPSCPGIFCARSRRGEDFSNLYNHHRIPISFPFPFSTCPCIDRQVKCFSSHLLSTPSVVTSHHPHLFLPYPPITMLFLELLLLGALPHLTHSLPSSLVPYDTVDALLGPRESGFLGIANISVSQICGTKSPTPALREIHNELRLDPETLPRLISRSPPRPFETRSEEEKRTGQIVVETFIHWVTTMDQARFYSSNTRAAVIQNQVRLHL